MISDLVFIKLIKEYIKISNKNTNHSHIIFMRLDNGHVLAAFHNNNNLQFNLFSLTNYVLVDNLKLYSIYFNVVNYTF